MFPNAAASLKIASKLCAIKAIFFALQKNPHVQYISSLGCWKS